MPATVTDRPQAGGGGSSSSKPTIVLVHGAWADSSSWQHVIPLLVGDGYRVVAVANPLQSIEGDVAVAKRLIDAQKGPVVVVAHSYGGIVATGAAAGNPNVKALVYLAAFGPDAGENIGATFQSYAPSQAVSIAAPDSAGFLFLDPSKFHDAFCSDVPDEEALIMSITQRPLSAGTFNQTVSAAAWKTIPSWFVVATKDKVIDPNLERFYAKRMKARTTEIDSSHCVMVSHPEEVTDIIREAVKATAEATAGAR